MTELMPWILFVITYSSGLHVTTQEFATHEKCRNARDMIIQKAKDTGYSISLKEAYCMEK